MTNSAGPEFVLSGYRGTSMRELGTYGNHWSSTAYSSATLAYGLSLVSNGTVGPAVNNYRYVGFSLRCLAEVAKS